MEIENDKINIELRSEALNEVLSQPPGWIVRSGNLFFFALLLLFLIFSWFISYSDEIQGTGTLSTSGPPFEIENLTPVQLKGICISDGQSIKENQVLAVFEENIFPEDVVEAEIYLQQMASRLSGESEILPAARANLQLGLFTPVWNQLFSSAKLQELHKDQRTVSNELHKMISELSMQFNAWKMKAVLTAPCDGKVVLTERLQRNKWYAVGEMDMIIVPSGKNYLVYATVAMNGAGKIHKGQKALVELADYPKNEFGILTGKVHSVSSVPRKGRYEIQIELPYQLQTTYHKQLPEKAFYSAKVRIITYEKRLLVRLMEKVTNL